jgi:hypothetical protein
MGESVGRNTARLKHGRRRLVVVGAALLVLTVACGDDSGGDATEPADTTTAEPTTTTAAQATELYPDHVGELYAGTDNWICHPDLATSPCDDIRTTVIAADGSMTVDELAPAEEPAIDCFYVYPTTSGDTTMNSDLAVDSTEINTVIAQAARYRSVCRVFAPAYRSITLAALGGGLPGDPTLARATAYGDVVDAWRTYVDEMGEGRGVVLIGHSQGAGHLRRLVDEEIGPDPAALERVVSAVLMGTSVGELTGMDPCASADVAGCLISFSSYPADHPPVEPAFFGRTESGPAVCVDPVALAGGNDLADVALPARPTLLGLVDGLAEVDTPFIAMPGALTAACQEAGGYGFLGVGPTGEADARPVDALLVERLGPTWGLHLLDGNLAQDDLIEVVTRQAEAWAAG